MNKEKKLVSKGWKTATIWLMIVLIVIVLSFIGLINIGTNVINNEDFCAYEVCVNADSYYFDIYSNTCYCVINNAVVSEQIIKR